MRAHMALKYSGQKIILREVELDNLPAEALAVSEHATVPSLVISEDKFLDESWDIAKWAIQQHDPDNWAGKNNEYLQEAEMLVETNDYSFQEDLGHYQHAEDHPQHPVEYYRQRCEEFLEELNGMLEQQNFLLADTVTIADIAVFPFIREFVRVDQHWFEESPYQALQRWFFYLLDTQWYAEASRKYDIWESASDDVYL